MELRNYGLIIEKVILQSEQELSSEKTAREAIYDISLILNMHSILGDFLQSWSKEILESKEFKKYNKDQS